MAFAGGEGSFAPEAMAWLSVAFDVQARGQAVTAPGALDLVNFERYQANFRLGFEF